MKISKRLKSLAGLITIDDKVADIGCDHALLDIYMVKNNITEKVFIADVSENALENGIKNVKKYHLEDKITAIVLRPFCLAGSIPSSKYNPM